ncbi:hypothetical protein AXG93_1403s1020 [Marchantia polymorpha subsp. ruderalis]|uniref:LRAT domain-containing protein n=1 Tax=Marchantia polymorpha subsp. ruderalis TaxID=1480154 RepID=A0A176VGW3_MARPO|nr:hypothetical protein AXG93_1403s1020 [Marchantia polymorpha subsp. ruderalis]
MESKGKGRLRSAAETLLAKPLSSAPENRLRKRMRPAAPQINSTSNELTSNERDVVSLSLRIRSQPFSLVPEGLKSANVTLLPEGLRSAVTKLPKRLKSTAGTLIEKGVRWTFHSIVTVTKYSQIPGESEFAIPEVIVLQFIQETREVKYKCSSSNDINFQFRVKVVGAVEFRSPICLFVQTHLHNTKAKRILCLNVYMEKDLQIRGDTEFAIPENTKSTKVVYMPSKYYTKLTVNTIFGGKYALDVEPGDHVYSYVNVLGLRVYIYSHHGDVLLVILVLFALCSSLLGLLRGNVSSKLAAKFGLTSELSNLTAAPSKPFWERLRRSRPDLQGIFDVDGLIIHNVADRERYNRDLKKCRLENCPTIRGTTTHLEKSSDREEILKRARDSLDKNDYGEFNLQDNNCEGFAVFCCTGQRGMGNQSWRVGDLMNYVKHVPFIRRITTQIGDHSASSLIVKIGQSFILKRRV